MENSFLPENQLGHPMSKSEKIKKIIFYAIGVVVFLLFFYYFLLSAPTNFPRGYVLKIDSGMNLRDISSLLKKNNVIRSRVAFEYVVLILGGEKHIISADYLLENKLPVWQVAERIVGGKNGAPLVSVTIPEGFNSNQIGDTFALKLADFNKAQFLLKAEGLEGYLFPDTYYFGNNAKDTDVIKSMNGNFEKKIKPFLPQIVSSGKSENEIIVMASLIEGEAKGDADRGVISGILWNRIKIGMPLEVDSAPLTYKVKGLPESPIGNPGIKAIEAAIHPQSSPYLYYLHDKSGNIHYAETFAQHEVNIKKYLK